MQKVNCNKIASFQIAYLAVRVKCHSSGATDVRATRSLCRTVRCWDSSQNCEHAWDSDRMITDIMICFDYRARLASFTRQSNYVHSTPSVATASDVTAFQVSLWITSSYICFSYYGQDARSEYAGISVSRGMILRFSPRRGDMLHPVLKVVWKSWGLPLTFYPFSFIPSLSLPHQSPWAGGWAPRTPLTLSPGCTDMGEIWPEGVMKSTFMGSPKL